MFLLYPLPLLKLFVLQDLLNFEDPLNVEASELYASDPAAFQLKVREYVSEFARRWLYAYRPAQPPVPAEIERVRDSYHYCVKDRSDCVIMPRYFRFTLFYLVHYFMSDFCFLLHSNYITYCCLQFTSLFSNRYVSNRTMLKLP